MLIRPTIWLLYPSGRRHARLQGRVDAEGGFVLTDVPVSCLDGPVQLEIGAKGFLTETRRVHGRDLAEGISLALHPPITVRGRFVDEQGKPVAGTRLDGWHGPWTSIHAVSDEEGRFEFLSPANRYVGMYLTHVNAPEGLLEVRGGASDQDLGDIVVPPGRPIRGRVLDAAGRPRKGLAVQLYTAERWGRHAGTAKTGADGSFSFGDRGTGWFEVFTKFRGEVDGRPALLGARRIGVRAGDHPVILTLVPLREVVLRLLDARTRKPASIVSPTTKLARRGDDPALYSPRQFQTHASTVTLYLVAPGEYDLRVGAPFRHERHLTLCVGDEPRTTIDVELWSIDDR
jgi:hypothetical protein